MRELAKIMVKAGIVSPEMQAEFKRWCILNDGEVVYPAPQSVEELTSAIEEALEEEHLVVVQETDVTALNQYLATMRVGKLHAVNGSQSGDFDVTYGVLATGEYLLPWKAESVSSLLTNGETYLTCLDDSVIYFKTARDLFFGDTKSFVVLTGYKKEKKDELGGTVPSTS